MSMFGSGSGSNSWNPLVWKPIYLRILRLYWMGETQVDIAARVGCSAGLVSNVINSDRGKEILSQLESKTFDSMLEVMNEAQAVAPEVIREKIQLALHSNDERIRTKNCTDLLNIAGHVPIHRVSIERPDPLEEKYKDKTADQLRQELLKLKDQAVPEKGPDGSLLN